jgi:hypothetical protein
MKKTASLYRCNQLPASIISHAVCWYFHFQLSLRGIELDILLLDGRACASPYPLVGKFTPSGNLRRTNS